MRRSSLSISLAGLLMLVAGCRDDFLPTAPGEPEPKPSPLPLGVYEFTVTGLTDGQVSSSAMLLETGAAPSGASASMAPVNNGLVLEQVTATSFTEGSRNSGGQRYVTMVYRVKNGSGLALSNLTFIASFGGSNNIAGTPFVRFDRFDGSPADTAIASKVIPTGAAELGEDLRLAGDQPDVLQVFTEGEVAAVALPANVTALFPYGFVTRHRSLTNTRQLPATNDPNQFDGLLTVAYRIPLARNDPGTTNGATKDVHTFTVRMLAVQDTEVRLTESMEEAFDPASVQRLQARAASLGATTVTVLNGSPAMDPSVTDYPGQRQLCSYRVAGTAAVPTTRNTSPGGYTSVAILRPSETADACAPYFRAGSAARPATNVPFTLSLRAVDRYGNLLASARDTVRLEVVSGPQATAGAPVILAAGAGSVPVTYHDYGNSVIAAVGRRIRTERLGASILVAGVTRTWTAGGGTANWHTGANWVGGAVPLSLDSVVIPLAAPLDPLLAANVSVQGVTVEEGAALNLGSFNLTAGGNVSAPINSGQGITNTTGRLVLAGTAKTVTGRLPRLQVTGTYTLIGELLLNTPAEVDQGGGLESVGFLIEIRHY
jgi:hypothetical protein